MWKEGVRCYARVRYLVHLDRGNSTEDKGIFPPRRLTTTVTRSSLPRNPMGFCFTCLTWTCARKPQPRRQVRIAQSTTLFVKSLPCERAVQSRPTARRQGEVAAASSAPYWEYVAAVPSLPISAALLRHAIWHVGVVCNSTHFCLCSAQPSSP